LKYTKTFEGCFFIDFDELPNSADYKRVEENLKGLITELSFNCKDVYFSGYEQVNTLNIILATNYAISLSQSNNSRYVCLNINKENIGNDNYKKIIIGIKSDEVLVNLYNEMMERLKNICPNWNEYIMPEIEFKKLK
jgi:hypothetical protein